MTVIGMDVHQRYCQVVLMDDDGSDPEEFRIDTSRGELEEFAREHAGAEVAFEATRNHWFVYDCLKDYLDVSVANPYETSLISDQPVKNDRLDAKRLAVLLRSGTLPTSYVPPDELREARKLVRQRKSLVEDRTSAKNRVRAVLADRGVTYDGDLYSESGREFLASEELPLSEADHELIEADLAVIDTFDERITQLTAEIDALAVSWDDTQLMMTIPGIGTVIAATIKAEVGEFERFDHKTEVVSYAGLDPAVRQSGDKETTGGITKEGPSVLRWALGQGALNAASYDPYIGNYYSRMKQHKPTKKALVAAARKLLVMIYAMVTKQEEYDPPGETPS